MRILRPLTLAIALSLVLGNQAVASIITLNATQWGRGNTLSWNGGPGFGNTFTGFSSLEYRTAWRFEIPNLTGLTVTGATLRLSFERAFAGLPESFALADVSSATIPLLNGNPDAATSAVIFADLGTGSAYGANTIALGTVNGTLINTTLSAAALANIQSSSSSPFAIGMRSTSMDEPVQDGFRWDANPRVYQLVLTTEEITSTPEPGTMALLTLTGLGGLGLRLRRRQSQQTAA